MQKGSCEMWVGNLRGDRRDVPCPGPAIVPNAARPAGNYWSATQVPRENLTITRDEGLKWYRSSDWARRGFCANCGSSLFWEMDGEGANLHWSRHA